MKRITNIFFLMILCLIFSCAKEKFQSVLKSNEEMVFKDKKGNKIQIPKGVHTINATLQKRKLTFNIMGKKIKMKMPRSSFIELMEVGHVLIPGEKIKQYYDLDVSIKETSVQGKLLIKSYESCIVAGRYINTRRDYILTGERRVEYYNIFKNKKLDFLFLKKEMKDIIASINLERSWSERSYQFIGICYVDHYY